MPLRLRHGAVCTGAFITIWRISELRLSAERNGVSGQCLQFAGANLWRPPCRWKSRKRTKMGSYWTCLCSCGYTCEVTASELVSGRKTHCGCKSVKNYATSDITGQRFGRLTAQYSTKKRDAKGFVIWHCQCDCGNEADVSYNSLMYCGQTSCGCKKKEHDKALGGFLTHVDGTSIDALKSRKIPSNNTTGVKGVYLVKGRYLAKIVFQHRQYFLGTYASVEEAAEARKKQKKS